MSIAMGTSILSRTSPLGIPAEHSAASTAVGAIAGPAARYEPELGALELDRTLARLLDTRRQTEWLLCRYLADIAEGRRFREVGYYSDVLHYARDRLCLSVKATRERLRIGRALRALPRIEQAFVTGRSVTRGCGS